MAGIYLKGLNWALHKHPIHHYKKDTDGNTILDFTSYEYVMFNESPLDRQASTPEEIALVESYRDRIKRQFAK